jgi:hypothetical protein
MDDQTVAHGTMNLAFREKNPQDTRHVPVIPDEPDLMSDTHDLFLETLRRYERPLIRYAHGYTGDLEDRSMEAATAPKPPTLNSDDLRAKIRSLPAINGWEWIKAGCQLFKLAPLHAAVVGFLMVLMPVLLSMVPAVGFLLSSLFTPVLTAGSFLVWEGLQRTGKLEIEDYFAGFRLRLESLVDGVCSACLLSQFWSP